MAEIEGQPATINGAETLVRLIERRKRLAQSIERADGEKREALKLEHAKLTATLEEINRELQSLGLGNSA